MKKILLLLCGFTMSIMTWAQKQFQLASPDGSITTNIEIGDKLTYNISVDGKQVLAPSPISITLSDGEVWGDKAKLSKSKKTSVNQTIPSPFYKRDQVTDQYNQLSLTFKKQWGIEFRAYNDGIAYRFVNQRKQPFTIEKEEVAYQFDSDVMTHIAYSNRGKDGDFNSQFMNSFENTYEVKKLSAQNKGRLMILPLVATTDDGINICISEVNLENYPGIFLTNKDKTNALTGVMAAYPKKTEQGGHNMLQFVVKERENYIAKVDGPRTFPWRVAIVTRTDAELANTDITYRLAEPSRLDDISWIKPGKVAWEWWNDWNLQGVDFKTGVNNETYKYYIDFAADHGIEYVILDEGWAVNLKADMMQIVPEINMKELVDYGKSKNVGIILWAGYHAFNRDMENICKYYADMGVKGFKVDFMDRDDQEMVAFNNRAAATCAKYKLLLDLHGMYKPSGLNRTYPNVLNFEGVHGLEQMKWSPNTVDQMTYDASIPFIRQVAGPMDYTQGSMRNATRENYYPCNSEPMSQGTRCHQLALYVVLESPLNMLCDAPTNYMRETESLEYIAKIPTVWDETIILDGKIGEYIVTARRHGDTWYIGGITNWNARDLTIDLNPLKISGKKAILFQDGTNAHRKASDYKKESITLANSLKIHLAPGGGFSLMTE